MINWANTQKKNWLRKEKYRQISKLLGNTCVLLDNPIIWNVKTEILYAEHDNLTSRKTVDEFINGHNAHLTVMENGEHWFHTDEQIEFLNNWMKNVI